MPEYYPPGFAYEVEPNGKIKKATIEAGQIAAGAVGTEQLAALAVTEPKVAANAITATQTKPIDLRTTISAVAGEQRPSSFIGDVRCTWVVYCAKGEANEVCKELKHFLNTNNVSLVVAVNMKATKTFLNALPIKVKEVTTTSAELATVTLEATPTAKDEIAFLFVG